MEAGLYDSTYRLEDTHWWFAGRRAIVFQELRRAWPTDGREQLVLDLGCGTGRNLAELATIARPVGLDLEDKALAYSRDRGMRRLVQATAERLPFEPETFSAVLALDLLEHLDEDVAGAQEVFRVLRPDGLFLAFVPAYRWLWGPQDDVSHHRRRYTPRSLTRVLTAAGFQVERLTHANLLLLPLILAGRAALRASRARVATENTLHPGWSNGLLRATFSAERHLLHEVDLPLGVSLLCVARKGGQAAA